MGIIRKIGSAVIPRKYKSSIIRLLKNIFHTGLVKLSGGEEEALFWLAAQRKLTAYTIVQGFLEGTFPMPQINDNKINIWYDPDPRGVIPVADFKIRNDLLRCLKKDRMQNAEKRFEVKLNSNFKQTVINCAKPRGEKTSTWITPQYIEVILKLHEIGLAHSVETYQDGMLVGGVFGVSLNGYFITLSLFRTVDNASKVAFCYLLTKLKEDGFKLHICGDADNWFTQFGAIIVSKEEFKIELIQAITSPVIFSSRLPELAV